MVRQLWEVSLEDEKTSVSHIGTLDHHTQNVNIVRFSNDGEMLATAADGNFFSLFFFISDLCRYILRKKILTSCENIQVERQYYGNELTRDVENGKRIICFAAIREAEIFLT